MVNPKLIIRNIYQLDDIANVLWQHRPQAQMDLGYVTLCVQSPDSFAVLKQNIIQYYQQKIKTNTKKKNKNWKTSVLSMLLVKVQACT